MSAIRSPRAWTPWVATLLLGCGGTEPAPSSPQPSAPLASASPKPAQPAQSAQPAAEAQPLEGKPKPDMPPPGSSLARVMRAHFKDALLIQQAVIDGRPDEAANPATVLSLIENLDDLPPGWREPVERMQLAAKRIVDSTNAAQTAGAVADLGVSCGLCHQKLGGPASSTEPAPAEGATVEERMKRHVWATARLWEGLVVPSTSAWNDGASAFGPNAFPPEVLKRGGVQARSAAGDFAKIVARASAQKTTEQRAGLYAELLVTCGTCHHALRDAKK